MCGQSESQQKREATPEDSDLDRKRRETEALLQSIGISPEPSLGTHYSYTLNNEFSIKGTVLSLQIFTYLSQYLQ